MGIKAAKFKAPDQEEDRKQIVKKTKRDLDEMLNEPDLNPESWFISDAIFLI